MTSRHVVLGFLVAASVLGVLRFAGAVYNVPATAHGDFAMTLPGAYAKILNPTLWNSADLSASYGFHRELYVYGPTQYLLLYPIVFLDSYAQISRVLSVVYAAALALTLFLIARLVARPGDLSRALLGVLAVALLFTPFYQVYIQKEFEIVVFLCLVAAAYLLARQHDTWAGILLGVIVWFKLWPVAFVAWFLAKRQFKVVAGMVIASCVTLGAAQLLFGLDRFIILSPSTSATIPGREFALATLIPRLEGARFGPIVPGPDSPVGFGFCEHWSETDQTAVGARWAVCRLGFSYSWLSPALMFYGLAVLLSAGALLGLVLLRRRPSASDEDRRWTAILEISLVTMGAALWLSAHYYYFVYLTLPFCALFYRYSCRQEWMKLGATATAYLLVSAFLVPVSVMSWMSGGDFWRFYIANVFYFYGELVLLALLLWEYVAAGLGDISVTDVRRAPRRFASEPAR